MTNSNKLQDITYKILVQNLNNTQLNEESKLKWIKETLNYLKMFPPQEDTIKAYETSEYLKQYKRPALNS